MSNKNTFETLKALCAEKGIVCERNGRLIELTTPNGGTCAICETVREAMETLHHDEAFALLPVKTPNKPASPFAELIGRSDRRIAGALAVLSEHHKGQEAIKALKALFVPASGLDSVNGKALLTLVEEFVKNSRRGFLA